MRILYVVEYYPPHVGGGETLFSSLAGELASQGHECRVLTCRLPGLPSFELRNGVKVHRVCAPSKGDRLWFTATAIPKALALARKSDIIHTMTFNGAPPACLAGKLTRKPVVLLAHEIVGCLWTRIGLGFMASRTYRFLERLILSLPVDAYAANSISTLRALAEAGVSRKKLHLVYPGVDTRLFKPVDDVETRKAVRRMLGVGKKDFMVLYYGRPGVVKGVEFLVKAAGILEKTLPQCRVLMVLSRKPAAMYKKVMRLIRAMGLGNIRVLDPYPRKALPRIIAAADCVAVPSLNEGFGFTAAEACAMRKTVVASRAGSLPEVLGGAYVLVRPGDAADLARGILDAWAGRVRVRPAREFSLEDSARAHMDLYSRLLS